MIETESRMSRFEHGGDVYSHRDAIDFSANLNPLGMPDEVMEAVRSQVPSYDAYPDIECRVLRDEIARAEGVEGSHIVCTAGATDLIHRLCLALRPETALVTAPCFSGYEQALEQVGACIFRHRLREEDGFELTERILDEGCASCDGEAAGLSRSCSLEDADIVFLCTPNNPTGLIIGRDLLVRILQRAQASNTVVMLDECFLDFTEGQSALDLCREFGNLVVMKAFTKLYAMAGLRLGYGVCSDAELLARLEAVGQPWAVSTPAQVAGVAALKVEGWVDRTRAYVAAQREVLARGLRDCGMKVVPGQANYLLFKSPCALYDSMLERGFIIRRCENYEGLDAGWYRIAVRTVEENAAFLAALKEVCS